MWSAPRIHTSCSRRILAALCGGGSALLEPLDDGAEARAEGEEPRFEEAADEPTEEAPEREAFERRVGTREPRQRPVLRRGLISIWPAFREPE